MRSMVLMTSLLSNTNTQGQFGNFPNKSFTAIDLLKLTMFSARSKMALTPRSHFLKVENLKNPTLLRFTGGKSLKVGSHRALEVTIHRAAASPSLGW